MNVAIKDLGFRRYAIFAKLMEEAWNRGETVSFNGAQGLPSTLMRF